jgi:hypothetical protein
MMRLGRLDKRAEVFALSPSLEPVSMGIRWVSIRAKDGGAVQQAVGLRSPALVEVRARSSDVLQNGRYLKIGDRLMIITSYRDPMGTGTDAVMSCAEFIGEAGEYSGEPCRVHLTHQAPYLDPNGLATQYKTLAEVALIETGRIQPGDTLTVGDYDYLVLSYAGGTDDGAVRGLWLEMLP